MSIAGVRHDPFDSSSAATTARPEHEPADLPGHLAAPADRAPGDVASPPADRTGTTHAPMTRVKRGICHGKCAPFASFREDRGGEGWQPLATHYARLDQMEFHELDGSSQSGACEGMTREVMRRTEHGTTNAAPSLVSIVEGMRRDAVRPQARAQMIQSINRFQQGLSHRLGDFVHYTRGPMIMIGPPEQSREDRTAYTMSSLHGMLQPNDMAYVRIALESREGSSRYAYGHTLLVQRQNSGHYSVFDPNNGAFEYENWGKLETAFRGYLDVAFSGTRYRPVPFQMQVYSHGSIAHPSDVTFLPPPQSVGPPRREFDFQLYGQSASSWNEMSVDALLPAGAAGVQVEEPAATLTTQILIDTASRPMRTLADATFRQNAMLADQLHRDQAVTQLNRIRQRYQSVSFADLPDHIRHRDTLDLRSADDLVDDLRTHLADAYISDEGPMAFRNDFAVIDLHSGGAVAATPLAEPPASVVVQRLNRVDDFQRDQYQLYDPHFGAFDYPDFEHLSDAVRNIFAHGYSMDGGIGRASTTWFANTTRWESLDGGSWHADLPVRSLNAGDATLAYADQQLGLRRNQPLIPPLANPPAPPRDQLESLQQLTELRGLKRSITQQAVDDPWVVFRPSASSPDQVALRGGFDSTQTPLRDVNLRTHSFDIAGHPGATDSAGWLGSFVKMKDAVERLPHGPRDGYIYAIAATPNMVNVNLSLDLPHGAPAKAAQRRGDPSGLNEFAALGHIDSTQIFGWWKIRGADLSPFELNRDFRWDVYGHLRTAGVQPQLARFPMNSPDWQKPAYQPFVVPVTTDGKRLAVAPKQDPNVLQADFFLHALSKIRRVADRQAGGRNYVGPMTVRPYGPGWQDVLYTDRNDNVYVYADGYAKAPGSTARFIMGRDGRFHYPDAYGKVLRIGADGYMYVGTVPSAPHSLNGVFQYANGHFVHAEDNKYLTVGRTVSTPFVSSHDGGIWSTWYLTDSGGHAVTPPAVNGNTYWNSTAGTREQLFSFDQDPDSALPAGATRFVTTVPTNAFHGTFLNYVRNPPQVNGTTARWLGAHNAAWLFRDGFYAFAPGPNQLQVRTLGGRPVWQASVNPVTQAESYRPLAPVESDYTIEDELWKYLQDQEAERAKLQARLVRAT